MLVVFLILFTKVLAGSKENKYVDLLPDAEKQQFIDNVARRILQAVESKQNVKNVESGELADEQLQKHNEYVKSILKQEADNVRRNKGYLIKDGDDKSGKTSNENENLGVKPLKTEKNTVPDVAGIEQVDNDSRGGIGDTDTSGDDIIVNIVTDNAPIIKRSVQNGTSNSDSESDDLTSETSEKVESKTEESNKVATVATEKSENESVEVQTTTTEGSKLVKSTTVNSEIIDSKSESSGEAEPIAEATEHGETKNIESKTGESKIKDTELNKSTTTGSKNESTEKGKFKNSDPSEAYEESVHVKDLTKPKSRKSNDKSHESTENTTENNTTTSEIEYYGVKLTENKSDEYSLATGDTEEFTTLTNPVDTPTTESVPTTQYIDNVTELVISTENTQNAEQDNNVITENYNKSIVTTTIVIVDEGTTDLVTPTLQMETTTNPTTIKTNTEPSTIKDTLTPYPKIEDMQIIVEDFTSAPTVRTSVDSFTLTTKGTTTTETSSENKFNPRDLEPTTEKTEIKPHKIKVHRLPNIIMGPKKKRDDATAEELKDKKRKRVKDNKNIETQNKNFIELEKVYYDNNYKVKTGKDYHVYEIPADKSPFIPDGEIVTELPYYVPVYNFSPNNAYFNPINRHEPNPDDFSREKRYIEDADVFSADVADHGNRQPISNENFNFETKSVEIEFHDIRTESKRKKFGTQQKLIHSIYKIPKQNNSQKRGKVNPEDYVDSDYYFGRVRKGHKKRFGNNTFHRSRYSNEGERKQELSLKDHIRAVRNIMFQQKYYGLDLDTEGNKKKSKLRNKERDKFKKVKHHNSDYDNSLNRHTKDKEDNDNIAIDYYFGRSKTSKPTAVIMDIKADEKTNEHFQKVGYLKDQNNTKELYVMDDYFKDNVVKYIHELKTKDKTYVTSDLRPATPLPNSKEDFPPDLLAKDVIISKFRDEEMKRNAEITSNFEKDNLAEKLMRLSNERNKYEKVKNAERTDNENNNVENNNMEEVDSVQKDEDTTNANDTKQELSLRMNRRNDIIKLSVYLQALKDMISLDNKGLQQYDWLGTTVDVQSSFQKLFQLIGLVFTDEDVHPADKEILKYLLFQHKLATEIMDANEFSVQLRKKLMLPRNKKKKEKHNMLKEKGLINRVWLYLRTEVPEVSERGALENLHKFLMATEDGLYDLHEAIKNIAKITKYKNQHWYQNLKELYLNTDEKHLLEVLLHMTTTRLFSLIEESAKNGLEDGYVQYMKQNKKEAKRTLEEMMFVIQIVDEINKL